MKLVIDISEDDYKKVQDGRAGVSMMRKAIRNGTPLPRCKDCKYYSEDGICNVHSEYEDKYTRGHVVCMDGDDYCSYGERKEQE